MESFFSNLEIIFELLDEKIYIQKDSEAFILIQIIQLKKNNSGVGVLMHAWRGRYLC